MSSTSERVRAAANEAIDMAVHGVTDDEARRRLAPLLPSERLLGDVRRRIRADEGAGPAQRRVALKYVYLAARAPRHAEPAVPAPSRIGA